MLPRKKNTFINIQRNKLSNLSFVYEDVGVVFCDEISMVGSCKFTKINFQLQDIFCNNSFMGGVSFIAVGDLRQLPPVLDRYVYEKNHLDGRPAISPSHWDEHFRIFYLTDKMRAQKDPVFASICDRVGNGKYTKEDIKYLKDCVRDTASEDINDNFKDGKLSYIVTTNKRRQDVNAMKLETLLKDAPAFESYAIDRCTNLEHPPEVPSNLAITQTGGLERTLILKTNAPIVITSNHQQAKYKEDGLVNGARGHIDSIQLSKGNSEDIKVVWVIFRDKNIGRRLSFDLKHLKVDHTPNHKDAIPILKQKKQFTINKGEVKFQRYQFPLTLAYAITAYKCQGETLEEVIIDFSHNPGERSIVQSGSFYVALTRVKEGKDVYLKSFCESFITFNERVEEKIEAMRKFKPYSFKKVYLSDCIFEDSDVEVKIGYFNIEGFLESNHAEYLDHDLNLLHLDFLVLSETWLTINISNKEVIKKLANWKIVKRLDSTDNGRHMGLMLITPNKKASSLNLIFDMDYVEGYTDGNATLLYQGITMNLKTIYKKFVFLYIRKTPSKSETVKIADRFSTFDGIIGDLNLNPAQTEQKSKLEKLCGNDKYLSLTEVTTMKLTQLDHIILQNDMSSHSFSTSYLNFASYHKSIVLRVATPNAKFRKEFKEGKYFNIDKHLKPNKHAENSTLTEEEFTDSNTCDKEAENIGDSSTDTDKCDRSPSILEQNVETNHPASIDLVLLRLQNPPLKNLCFSNVVASCLINIPVLRKFLRGKTSEFDNQRTITAELSRLARHLSSSLKSTQRLRTIVMTKCLMSGISNRNFNNNTQFDCVEFIQSLFEHFWEEQSWDEDLEEQMFGGLLQERLECNCGNIQKLPIQKLAEVLHLQIRGKTTQNCTDEFFSTQEVDSRCPVCPSTKRKKIVEIVCSPTTVILHLLRFSYDEKQDKTLKSTCPIFCPTMLTLPNGSTYVLNSVINHIGESSTSGHYNIVIFDEQLNKFILLDDSEITYNINIDKDMAEQSYVASYSRI